MGIHPAFQEALDTIKKGEILGTTRITQTLLGTLRDVIIASKANKSEEFWSEISAHCDCLVNEQPMNISLQNGIRYIYNRIEVLFKEGAGVDELRRIAKESTNSFIKMMDDSFEQIGEIGSKIIESGDVIITHAYASTVLSILAKAHQRGKKIKVIVAEARPEFYGRLLAMALADFGIPVMLIVDSAHNLLMRKVTKVLIGAIGIAPTGEVLTRIGASAIAIAAHEAQVKVYVPASIQKFSPKADLIHDIIDEEGARSLIFSSEGASELGIKIANPLYDVILPKYVDLFITERGLARPQAIKSMIKEIYNLRAE